MTNAIQMHAMSYREIIVRNKPFVFCSVPLYIAVQGLIFYLFTNEGNRKLEKHHSQKNR